MASRGTKGVALTVAAGVLTFGVQQLTAMNYYAGGAAIVIGGVIFVGYQVLEDSDHRQVYDDVVESIGEENLKAIAEASGDEIRKAIENARQQD